MKKSIIIISISIFIILNIPLLAKDTKVRICNDSGEWAPYFYYQRDINGDKTDKLVGATVDSLDAIFKIIGLEYEFELLPWKRCLAHVERFDKVQNFEMFSEAGVNEWRKQRYIHTKEPVYGRTNVFYYNNEKFPKGLDIKTVKDMEKYKICVGRGLSFERYIKAGLDPKLVDTSHKTEYIDIIRKISLGYCDIMPANLAIIEGGVKIKQFKLPSNISYTKDTTINSPFFYHYWISKKSPRATKLKNKIDEAIRTLKENGQWEKIYKKYLSSGSGI